MSHNNATSAQRQDEAPDPFALDGGPAAWERIGRAERAIGLVPDCRADFRRAKLPALLAAAYQLPMKAFGADCVGALLAGVARDLRTLATLYRISDRRGDNSAVRRQQARDARALLRNAAQRAEVAAELHRRLMIGLAHYEAATCEERAKASAEARFERWKREYERDHSHGPDEKGGGG